MVNYSNKPPPHLLRYRYLFKSINSRRQVERISTSICSPMEMKFFPPRASCVWCHALAYGGCLTFGTMGFIKGLFTKRLAQPKTVGSTVRSDARPPTVAQIWPGQGVCEQLVSSYEVRHRMYLLTPDIYLMWHLNGYNEYLFFFLSSDSACTLISNCAVIVRSSYCGITSSFALSWKLRQVIWSTCSQLLVAQRLFKCLWAAKVTLWHSL